jgi:hypothetical protein
MATLDPMATYTFADAATLLGLSEQFLTGLIGRAVKAGYIKLQPGFTVLGSSLSRLGKVYHASIETELHRMAFMRVRARDAEEALERERGE